MAFSEIFVVISNADAGVGTLREALTKAASNGIAEKDYIHFNLSGNTEADRTITLATALPYISSNLVIDGTTQPGNSFGVSNAKVVLQPQNSSSPYNAFVLIDIDGFEIYGFYVRDFMGPILNGPTQSIYSISAVLYVENARNIQIGAPGKGNVFVNNGLILSTLYVSLKTGVGVPPMGVENLKVYSNFFGFEPDGKTFRGTPRGYLGGIDLAYCKGIIEIGGKEDSKRNIFGNGTHYISGKNTTPDKYFPTEFLIENNYFGYSVNGDPVLLPNFNGSTINAVHFSLSGYIGYTAYAPYSFKILNNKIQGSHSIMIEDVLGQIILQGNVIKREALPNNPSYKPFFWLFTKDIVKIGGLLPGEANSIENGQLMLDAVKSLLVQRNSLYCVDIRLGEEVYNGPVNLLPHIEITNVSAGSVSGTATPNSKIELFWDDDCEKCHPLTYFATVTADENGLWKFEGAIERGVIASATYNGFTSQFTITYNNQYAQILHSSCGEANGSIIGQRYKNAGGYEWRNEAEEIVGSDADISGLLPGKYVLSVLNGSCTQRFTFTILDGTPKFNTSSVYKINPSCGISNGAITNLSINYNGINYSVKWYDQEGKIRGTDYNLRNVEAGTYHAEVTYNNCTVKSPYYTLSNQTGPNIDQSAPDIKGSLCNSPTGSIKNLAVTGSGTLIYKWKNAAGQLVGSSSELLDVPAGSYTLEVKDGSACPALVSAPIMVPEINGVTVNTANKVIGKAACNTSNGSITGIIVAGATSYQWIDAGNTPVANTLNLTGMPAGKYRLVASNATCNKTSEELTIELVQTTKDYATTKVSTSATCALNNGKIEAIFTKDQPAACFWKNNAGVVVGHSRILENQGPGTYDLYAIDDLGCEHLLQQYSIGNISGATINRNLEQITNDQCGLGRGRIKAPGLTGGQLPYFYQWKDKDGHVIGSNAVLDGLKAGDYQLTIGDALDCSRQIIPYSIENESSTLPVPVVNDVKICSSGNALIQVQQAQNGTYVLYNANGTLIAQNITGAFNVEIKESQHFSIVLRQGTCESLAASAKITIENDGIGVFANAFSPNGDGHNDEWLIPGMQSYPEATIAIYNRYGHKVFESTGYKTPFNGRWNGAELPVGTYYYIIDLKRGCGLQKGSLSIIR
ncbi:gliding motility-associated C-terminal domain-containing protein [Pedobacter heparinus]|uniref:Ig-like domain-containing protein n=1 Tax=Pedobacter heparinus (strain ATCC 13125 / DSM 2366 / CIP 104194 / JCM 7457 / NBRC 12017 / NCIMB 9290 / NRRL B-14731 / HIM 762-3) TaxID=485917 RepID=C6Y2D0_PEDHD|nr:T9SS C-terminal target domain-containing protein [Pedobacter heparinus]ACU03123.1 hypothetical protein Phep_0901 [Pedobacter heparinus DSM 2366]